MSSHLLWLTDLGDRHTKIMTALEVLRKQDQTIDSQARQAQSGIQFNRKECVALCSTNIGHTSSKMLNQHSSTWWVQETIICWTLIRIQFAGSLVSWRTYVGLMFQMNHLQPRNKNVHSNWWQRRKVCTFHNNFGYHRPDCRRVGIIDVDEGSAPRKRTTKLFVKSEASACAK